MTESDVVNSNATTPPVPAVLHVVYTEAGIHLVNDGTLEAASEAQREANDAPYDDDEDDLRSESELDNEVAVENVWAHTVAMGMCDDVPSEVIAEFNAYQNLMFVEYQYCAVAADRLEAMIAALEAHGFKIERD
jgi:hypothetical protein